MRWFYQILVGFYLVEFSSPEPQRILEMLLKQNIPVFNIETEEGKVSFCILSYHEKYVRGFSLLEGERILKKEKGSLGVLRRFQKRWGIVLGGTLSLILLLVSTFFVWSIEVVGNQEFTDTEIRSLLVQEGLKPGVLLRSISPSDFSLLFQVHHPEFSFTSLNLIGTHAVFTVRERESVEKEEEKSDAPCNLVASVSGKIIRFETAAGKIMVKQGQIVPKGALLISGVRERKNGSFAICRGEGKVYAETTRFFETTVLYEWTEKVYTGREEERKEYECLWFRLSYPPLSSVSFSEYSVMETEENLTLFGKELPVLCRTKTYSEQVEQNEKITVDTARKKAYDNYEEYKRETFASDSEILEENVEIIEGEEGLTLKIEVVAVENIAVEKPFSFSVF